MRKFKVGDRVAAYDRTRFVGTVTEILPDGNIKVELGSWSGSFHPMQCHKITKRKRRELWAVYCDNGLCHVTGFEHDARSSFNNYRERHAYRKIELVRLLETKKK